MAIEVKIIDKGTWVNIQIVSVSKGFSRILKDGKWVNATDKEEVFEDEILTLGKQFDSYSDAEKFMKTKSFKSLYNNIQKNWSCL